MSLVSSAVQAAWLASLSSAARRFRAEVMAPERAQDGRLRVILREVAASDYGRRHRLHEVGSYADFARRVRFRPIDRIDIV
ncbi:MAG: hypothetical protein AAB426_08800, partial [Myxococcota bacterium]